MAEFTPTRNGVAASRWTSLRNPTCNSFICLYIALLSMADVTQSARPKKLCFVTIGATASFDSLIKATTSPSFLEVLDDAGYTDLLLQYGKEGKVLLDQCNEAHCLDSGKSYGISITGFDFNSKGLGSEMRAAKGEQGGQEGLVISHAGIVLTLFPVRKVMLMHVD